MRKHLYLWETRREHLCDFSSVSILIFHLFCDDDDDDDYDDDDDDIGW